MKQQFFKKYLCNAYWILVAVSIAWVHNCEVMGQEPRVGGELAPELMAFWENVPDTDLDGYYFHIQKPDPTKADPWTTDIKWYVLTNRVSVTEIIRTFPLEPGQEYRLKVQAVNKAGLEGGLSDDFVLYTYTIPSKPNGVGVEVPGRSVTINIQQSTNHFYLTMQNGQKNP